MHAPTLQLAHAPPPVPEDEISLSNAGSWPDACAASVASAPAKAISGYRGRLTPQPILCLWPKLKCMPLINLWLFEEQKLAAEKAIENPYKSGSLKCHISCKTPEISFRYPSLIMVSCHKCISCHIHSCYYKNCNYDYINVEEPSSPLLFHAVKLKVDIKVYVFFLDPAFFETCIFQVVKN